MAPPQSITVIDPLPWSRSTTMRLALSELVYVGQLAVNEDGQPPAWIDPPARDREPNPPFGYVVSFIRFHERGFAVPASRFLRGLCFHYGVELHNFASNVRRCVRGIPGDPSELGYLGSPLPRGAAYTRHAGAKDAPRGARRRRDNPGLLPWTGNDEPGLPP
jgi:hypothetical protein